MFIIRLTVNTNAPSTRISGRVSGDAIHRYAQNPSATWDGAAFVCRKDDAKRFKSIASAERWLVRHGFAERGTGLIVGPVFTDWQIAAPEKFI